MRFIFWFCLCAAAPLLAACPGIEKSGAQGSSREISVFANVPRDGDAYRRMEDIFEYEINAVRPEQFFILDPAPFDQFNVHRQFKNQLFLVDLSQDDDLARSVPGYLGERGRELMRSGDPFTLLVRDTWALGQSTLYLVAHSRPQLEAMLDSTNAEALRRQFETSVYEALGETLYTMGDNESLSRRTAREYGWHLRLLPEFKAVADPEGNFVKFDAKDPVRLLLVHWLPGRELPLDPEDWRPHLDRILDRYNDKDYISDPDTRVFPTTFQDRPAIKWEGVWQNDKYTIGGAFRAYGFHRGGTSYLLVTMIYNPAGDKVPPLIQTEAILRTFKVLD